MILMILENDEGKLIREISKDMPSFVLLYHDTEC